MVRRRAPGRFDEILDAALSLFTEKGFRATRMDEVARAANVSPGLLYTYVVGKEALFQLVVQRELGVDLTVIALPAAAASRRELDALTKKGMRTVVAVPSLEAALRRGCPPASGVRAEAAEIVGDIYDRIHRYRRLIRLVERSADETARDGDEFYERGRIPFVRRIATYIEQRVASGDLAPVRDATAAARFVLESVSWFANHRHGDHEAASMDEDVSRDTVVQLVPAALIGAPARTRRRKAT